MNTGQIMPANKTFQVVFSDTDFTTSITSVNDSFTVNDVLTQNGLMPRDGTFRYVSSPSGTMINHMPMALAPRVLTVQNPKNVIQVWIENNVNTSTQKTLVFSEDEKYFLYGVKRDIHADIFLTNWYSGTVRHGYSFSPVGEPYKTGTIVFLQVPRKGNQSKLFNPQNGKEDYQVRLLGDLEPMRGFWSAWQIEPDVNTATFRGDISPVPTGFKPWQPNVKARPQPELASRKEDPRPRPIKFNSLKSISNEPSIFSCQISKNNPSRDGFAIVCGTKSNSSGSNIGYVAAWGNKNRPTMINRAGYQYEMSVFVKIPEEGRVTQVYNSIQDVHVNCRLTDSEHLRVEDLRGRWVIAQLRRHCKHKRVLKLHSMPSDVA